MSEAPVSYQSTDGIAVITINRPERRNALDVEHYAALSKAWCRVRDDSLTPPDLSDKQARAARVFSCRCAPVRS